MSRSGTRRKDGSMPGKRRSSQGLSNIGGLGKEYLEKLREAGIRTLEDLIERMRTPRSRKELGKATGIERKDLREWAGQAELLSIEGIGPAYAEKLAWLESLEAPGSGRPHRRPPDRPDRN